MRQRYGMQKLQIVLRWFNGTTLSYVAERKASLEAVKQSESATFTEDYIDTLERRYIDTLSVKVMEMRLR